MTQTAATPNSAAPAASIITAPQTVTSELDLAYVRFLLALKNARPRPLKLLNSRAALQDRADAIELQFQAFAIWAEALIEDSAAHVNMCRREADYAKAVLLDLGSDLHGKLVQAMDGVVAA